MGEEPEVIERQIGATRERMGERVDALEYKADVKSRVGDAIAEKRDAVTGRVRGAMPSGEEIRGRARRGGQLVRENPYALALGAAAAGVLIGLLLPSTRIEDERIGEAGDTVRRKLAETGQEAASRGQQVARDAAEAARESGGGHAAELGENARERASDAIDSVRGG